MTAAVEIPGWLLIDRLSYDTRAIVEIEKLATRSDAELTDVVAFDPGPAATLKSLFERMGG